MRGIYKAYLLAAILTWVILLAPLNVIDITLYTLFLILSIAALRMGLLAKFVSITFYLFVFSRTAILFFYPDNFNFPYPVHLYNNHTDILFYSLYYYAILMLGCFLFEKRAIDENFVHIPKKVVTYCMLYMLFITILFVSNNNALSFSNYGYSDGFLMIKKIWNHSNFALIVLLLCYKGFLRRVFLSSMILIGFIYYPSKAILFDIVAPIFIGREIRGKSTSILIIALMFILFVMMYVLADTFRVNSYLNIQYFLSRIASALMSILGRIGFNYDMALYYSDQFNGLYYVKDIVKSVINGYVPGEIFDTARILTGSDMQAVEEGKLIETFDKLGGGYTMGYYIFDRAYFGYYAPLIALFLMYPIIKIYNKGNIIYKVLIVIGFFHVGNSDSILVFLKILNNILLFYLFVLFVDITQKIFKPFYKKIP